jgi:nitroimidazol reductase NimA-like FMN-containing flavoprotein (pyridoxamine 5'-phosphate oxidase superfamily)
MAAWRRTNVHREPRVCLEIDEVGEVFDYGRFECDVSIAHRSVVTLGRIRVIEDRALKQRFCDALMAKYHGRDVGRPGTTPGCRTQKPLDAAADRYDI